MQLSTNLCPYVTGSSSIWYSTANWQNGVGPAMICSCTRQYRSPPGVRPWARMASGSTGGNQRLFQTPVKLMKSWSWYS